MKKILIATAVAALTVTGAQAADMAARTYTKAPMMAQVYNWTGFYVGANAGYVEGRSNVSPSFDPATFVAPLFNAAASNRVSASGFIGGGQVGYNLQVAPNWLIGLEADIDYTDLNGTRVTQILPLGTNQVQQSFKSDWLATVRGRVGYTFDRVLVYGTGGLAVAEIKTQDNVGIPLSAFSGASKTKAGWTAGGGIEWAFAQSWTVKAEYLYVDLGNVNSGPLAGGGLAANPLTVIGHKVTEDIGRVGVNYRF